MKRGEIWLANLDPTIGNEIQKTRPVAVVSNNKNNTYNSVVTILPITSNTKHIFSFEVLLKKGVANLPKDSKIKADQIRTIDKIRLIKKIGKVPTSYLSKINAAIQLHLDLI
ncbi:MAG: type II toxin-antitoxin system PemK/MazF family toxin [Bacteroidetes bacterium]|nr:type II toxin-antitoxin system PemK/MazF family toxin [Bacteroidota bacterium]